MRHLRRAAPRAAAAAAPALRAASRAGLAWAALAASSLVALLVAGGLPLVERSPLGGFGDRSMGMALASGVDVSADLLRYGALLVAGAVALCGCLAAASLVEGRLGLAGAPADARREGHLSAALELGAVGLVVAWAAIVAGSPAWPVVPCLALCTLHYALGLASLARPVPSAGTVSSALLALAPLALLAYVTHVVSRWASPGTLVALALAALLAAAAAASWRGPCGRDEGRLSLALSAAALPLLATVPINSVLLELKNVLAARGVIDGARPYAVYVALTCAAALAAAAILLLAPRRLRPGRAAALERAGYALLVLGVVLCACQPDVTVAYGTEYFESANHGLALDALFRRGELPLVGNFDAHMLLRELPGALYYLLNPYEPWGYMLYDALCYVPVALIFHRVLARLVSERAAAAWVVLSPVFLLTVATRRLLPSLCYGVVPLAALLHALRRPTLRSYALFCLSVVGVCLLGLDAGVAAIAAGAATFLVAAARVRGSVRVGRLALVSLATVACAGAAWALLCLASGADPVSRLREFVALASSNASWATSSVGDPESVGVALCYFVLPAAAVAVAVRYALFEGVDLGDGERSRRLLATWAGALFFSVFFLANLSRGVVRHNLSEGSALVVFSTFGLMTLCVVLHRAELSGAPPARAFCRLAGASAAVALLMGLSVPQGASTLGLFGSALEHAAQTWSSAEAYKELPVAGSRVTGGSAADETLTAVLDATLTDGETFLTLSSDDYLHAVTGRDNPLYANQSPLMLSGDLSQEMALDELEAADVTYVLMPRELGCAIDGVDVCLKYYALFERVYEDYEPFVRIDGASYDLWCPRGRADELRAALEASGPASGWSFVTDWPAEFPGMPGLIPLAWAELDEAGAWDGATLASAGAALPVSLGAGEAVEVPLDRAVGGEPAYLALTVRAQTDGALTLSFRPEGAEPRELTISLRAGEHRYLVRASAYYEWWEGDVGSVTLTGLVPAELVGLDVVEGDGPGGA